MRYFRGMLRQMLDRQHVPRSAEWGEVLGRLLLKASANVSPDVRHGDAMDASKYVKIKRIPGGAIWQSEYVDGVVITQNLAHKQMARHLISPRVMLLTFPLDYHRVDNQFMSLEPLLAQERNYLKHLTKRVIDLRPHLVLVGPSVSKLALDFLLEAKIAVSRGVKQTAINEVARSTQADVITSMDKMALEPRLGRCTEFRVQTYEHPSIPGYRKTFMRFEGCNAELGCTLVLRGNKNESLAKVKQIAHFMACAVVNMKWETCSYFDQFGMAPTEEPAWSPDMNSTDSNDWLQTWSQEGTAAPRKTPKDARSPEPLSQSDRQTADIAKSIILYTETAISTSSAVKYPPPSPLAKMGKLDYLLRRLRKERDDAEAAQILIAERRTPNMEATSLASPLPALPDGDASVGSKGLLIPPPALIGPVNPLPGPAEPLPAVEEAAIKEVPSAVVTSSVILNRAADVKQDSDIAQVEHNHAEQLKIWSWYISRHSTPPRIEDYQHIMYLKSSHRMDQEKACTGPTIATTTFYSEDDCTLGQYIEKITASASQPCANRACPKAVLHHFQLLVHGETRLQIAMDPFPCPAPGQEDQIITWSYCKVCKTPSATMLLREETWKMSWAKYLEAAFYPPRSGKSRNCQHDIYRDHVRYFAHRNLAVRIHNETIPVLDVVRPSLQLQIRQEYRVNVKNEEHSSLVHKINAFFDSMSVRIRTFDTSDVQTHLLETLKAALDTLQSRVTNQRLAAMDQLDRTYKMTGISDVLALNSVYLSLQDTVIQLDNEFQEIEKRYVPYKNDLQGMTAAQFARLLRSVDFGGDKERSVSGTSVSSVSDIEEDAQTSGSHRDMPMPEVVISAAESPLCDIRGDRPPADGGLGPPCDGESSNLSDLSDGATPLAEHPPKSPLVDADHPNPATDSPDSDSTISALPREKTHKADDTRAGGPIPSSPEMERRKPPSPFVSRLPRRTRPTPTVADLISTFQATNHNEGALEQEGETAHPQRLNSPQRPKLARRGKTEGYQHAKQYESRQFALSDDDRGYAANASRMAMGPPIRRIPAQQCGIEAFVQANSRPSSRNASRLPLPIDTGLASARLPSLVSNASRRGSLRATSGKMPLRQTTDPTIRQSQLAPGLRTPGRRNLGANAGNSKVSSISQHYEGLSAAAARAEKERQKKLALARTRRARPVTMTKAKVQVFRNVREAFHDDDEEDEDAGSESSGADDEGDNAIGPDDAGMETDAAEQGRPQVAVPTSSSTAKVDPPLRSIHDDVSEAFDGKDSLLDDTFRSSANKAAKGSSLQMTLAPYETAAPLLSVPPTPTLAAKDSSPQERAQLSESDASAGPTDKNPGFYKTIGTLLKVRSDDLPLLDYPL